MQTLKDLFGVEKPLIAMCHLEGLPGRPRYDSDGGIEVIVSSARREIEALQDGGVDAILFCNENDIPYSTSVGPEVVATMTHVIGRLHDDLRVPYGTNLLWDRRRASPPPWPAARRSSVRSSPASTTRTWACWRLISARWPGTVRRSVADTLPCSPTSRPSSADPWAAAQSPSGPPARRTWESMRCSYPARRQVSMRGMSDLREAKDAVDIPVLANTGVKHETIDEVLAIADGAIVGHQPEG